MKRTVFLCVASLALAAGCRTAPPTPRAYDPEVAKLARTAALTHQRISAARALPLYRAALARAEALGDFEVMGVLAHNLAVCQAETGDLTAALASARAAARDLERAGRSAADPLTLEAALLRALEGPPAARAAAERALAAARAARRRDLQAQIHALRAELALDEGDVERAAAELSAADRALSKGDAPAARARVEGARGRLAERQERFPAAALAYTREAEQWGRAGLMRRVPLAFQRAAEAALRAGNTGLAAERFLDAARSLAGQGEDAAAREHLQRIAAMPAGEVPPEIRAAAEKLSERLAPPPEASAPSAPNTSRAE